MTRKERIGVALFLLVVVALTVWQCFVQDPVISGLGGGK